MPNRHSMFWRLVLLVASFCLAMVWVSDHVDQRVAYHSSFLSAQARQTLQEYAEQASAAVDKGPIEVDRWMRSEERRVGKASGARWGPCGSAGSTASRSERCRQVS